MRDKTITRRVARYRRKLKADRGWVRVEVLIPATGAEALKSFAATLRGDSPATALAPFFAAMAKRYFWWKSPEELSASPRRIALQVMDIGSFDDAQLLARVAGEAFLKDALRSAESGQLSPRSWAYWNYRLGLARPGEPPPTLPARSFA